MFQAEYPEFKAGSATLDPQSALSLAQNAGAYPLGAQTSQQAAQSMAAGLRRAELANINQQNGGSTNPYNPNLYGLDPLKSLKNQQNTALGGAKKFERQSRW